MVERLRDSSALAEEKEGEVEKLKREKSLVKFLSRDIFEPFLIENHFPLISGISPLIAASCGW